MIRLRLSIRLLAVLAVAASAMALPVAAGAASAPPGMPPKGKVMLGVGGHALEPQQFDQLTGAEHELWLITVPWNEQRPWEYALGAHLQAARDHGYRLMVHIGTQHAETGREARSPGAVASGVSDRYFIEMSRLLNESDQVAYVRPPAEMNGHWNHWAAYNVDGSRRNAAHSTASYRKAFIRIAAISRGGDVAKINTALRRNGMPPLRTSQTELPSSGRISTVFNPQARGAPDVPGNMPAAYYPGAAWVDYVANDLYVQNGRAAWDAQEAMYRQFKAHPFMVAEYAPWGYDDPAFMRRMFEWVASHPRTVGLIYFNGTGATTFRLASKPRSLAAYRSLARQARYRCPALSSTVQTCTAPPPAPGSADLPRVLY